MENSRNALYFAKGNENRGKGAGVGCVHSIKGAWHGVSLPAYFTIFIAKARKLFAKLNFN